MKRFALLLITAILSLNCMAQSDDGIIVLNLQQVEFRDTSITKALSSVIQNPPKNSMIPKHLTLDFYQSSLPVDQYFLFLSRFSPSKEDMHQFAYYAVIDDYIFIMPKIPSKYIRILSPKRKFKRDLLSFLHVGGSYYGIIRKKGFEHWQILFNGTIGE